jgi:RNA polymerase sigma factor (sigma-70 family)
MAKLWVKRGELERYGSIEALAMTMAKNFCLDQLKSKRAGNLRIVHSQYADRQAGLQQQVEDRNSLEWVEKAMNGLPEQQRLILQLRDVEEYEFDTIAAIMEMNETAVRVALSRARKAIREFMQKTHSYGIGREN